ncbi:MAG: hypothetical protein EBX40_04895 [Gammaproteobacteria bacterium]|nr:hypothetical protein [Gammaproteobacteria bacterium]
MAPQTPESVLNEALITLSTEISKYINSDKEHSTTTHEARAAKLNSEIQKALELTEHVIAWNQTFLADLLREKVGEPVDGYAGPDADRERMIVKFAAQLRRALNAFEAWNADLTRKTFSMSWLVNRTGDLSYRVIPAFLKDTLKKLDQIKVEAPLSEAVAEAPPMAGSPQAADAEPSATLHPITEELPETGGASSDDSVLEVTPQSSAHNSKAEVVSSKPAPVTHPEAVAAPSESTAPVNALSEDDLKPQEKNTVGALPVAEAESLNSAGDSIASIARQETDAGVIDIASNNAPHASGAFSMANAFTTMAATTTEATANSATATEPVKAVTTRNPGLVAAVVAPSMPNVPAVTLPTAAARGGAPRGNGRGNGSLRQRRGGATASTMSVPVPENNGDAAPSSESGPTV